MDDLREHRRTMVERQIAGRGIRDARVLAAMERVPREQFVEPGYESEAYGDHPLPIGEGQTISQPYIVALMSEAAAVRPGDRVLEVGTGSGYGAAVLAELGAELFTIERNPRLAERARERLAGAGYDRVEVVTGDGSLGLPEQAPFDAIIVTAASPDVPPALTGQLREGGRLVIPIGQAQDIQHLLRIRRIASDQYDREELGAVRFVPLIGAQGWAPGERD